MRIGITERGDAGWDLSWHEKCRKKLYDGAVLITKYVMDRFIDYVMDLYEEGFPIIVHATVTGWGGTVVEPGIHDYKTQLENTKKLCERGFPVKNIVIRVDPIWPTKSGLERASEVIGKACDMGLLSKDGDKARMRVSILDEYRHVKERICASGHQPVYGDRFYPSFAMVKATADMLKDMGVPFETCAEEKLANMCPGLAVVKGCISETDLRLMGLDTKEALIMSETMPRRSGCHCLSCKSEMLARRKQCPTKCIYCYWK